MPQQRRKLPFSGKKKKDQLLQKRSAKATPSYLRSTKSSGEDSDAAADTTTSRKLMEQPINRDGGGGGGGRKKNVNRYNLQFMQESKAELELMKMEGFKNLEMLTPEQKEIGSKYFENFDFPVRPAWSDNTTKEQLDRNENRYFREYVDEVIKRQKEAAGQELSLFELNLETWRQFWRVLEFSDILLIIVDVRFSSLMFPPSLYDYIIKTLKRHAIVVFNKVDLVQPEVVVAWQEYFKQLYPEVPIVMFASYASRSSKDGKQKGRLLHRRCMEGVYQIYLECQRYVQDEVNLSEWQQKILEDLHTEEAFIVDQEKAKAEKEHVHIVSKLDATPQQHVRYRNGELTIGCIGYPNVGKSSLINALMGRKVVSVSRTPGHTKHFQTIYLTRQVRLCDCPGLVFPSSTPKSLQVLLGSFPISQLQVPYRSLKLLAEHINLPQVLRLTMPPDFEEWSAVAIAEAWAFKRGFLTAKAARPDRYRAANHILRTCLVGQQQLILQIYPPGFEQQRDNWSHHTDIEKVMKYQKLEDTEQVEGNHDEDNDDDASDEDVTAGSETDEEEKESAEESMPASRNVFRLLEDDAS